MSHDPTERRDTRLARKLKERIRREGPISVAAYMHACLHDPEHGYYRKCQAIGAAADFITAPEISQVFGELIGLWCAVVWQQMGSPAKVNLVELGPGRGTLMRDALRAARIVPGFSAAISLHLIESNEALRDVQAATLSDVEASKSWHSEMIDVSNSDRVATAPTIIVANEFLDTFDVSQFVFHGGHWHERGVGLATDNQFVLVLLERDPEFRTYTPAHEGCIVERAGDYGTLGARVLGNLADVTPTAALFVDYGHTATQAGDTLQAVAEHRCVSPFFAPGEMDLTAEVNFEMFATLCGGPTKGGQRPAVDGPVTQAEFLGSLGIMERASRLMAENPVKAAEIETGVARLMAPAGMGTRYKVIGVRDPSLPPLPGFA